MEQIFDHLHFKEENLVSILKEIGKSLLIMLTISGYAFGVNYFLIPNKIVGGALTGICELIYFGSGVEVYLTEAIFNCLLLMVAILTIGWKFCFHTLAGVCGLIFWLYVIPIREVPIIQSDFVSTIVGGICCGITLGLVFLLGGSTGGTDIIAKIVNKYYVFDIGTTLFLLDFIIIPCFLFLPDGNILKVLCGLLFSFVCAFFVNIITKKWRH